MGDFEKRYKKRKELESEFRVDYTEAYYEVALPMKDSLPRIVDAAAKNLPEKFEHIYCDGLPHVGWYITDTFVPDYIDGLNFKVDKERNWIFLIPERYPNTPALVCAFLMERGRLFKEYYEINLDKRSINDFPPELSYAQLLKIKDGLDRFSKELGLFE